jgi:hypothetical protein
MVTAKILQIINEFVYTKYNTTDMNLKYTIKKPVGLFVE